MATKYKILCFMVHCFSRLKPNAKAQAGLCIAYIPADSEHCFDRSGLVSEVGHVSRFAGRFYKNCCNWYTVVINHKQKSLLWHIQYSLLA